MLSIFFIGMIPNTIHSAVTKNDYLEELISRNIITPYSDGDYRLDRNVTRGEYLTALYKTVCIIDSYGILKDREIEEKRAELISNIKETYIEGSEYKDLSGHWSENQVNWIKNYINERQKDYFNAIFPGDEFNPGVFITKEEIAAVTKPFSTPLTNIDKEKYRKLEDLDESNRFYNEITFLLENQIILSSKENYFGINDFITRNDLTIIMNNLLKDMNYRKNFFIYNDIKEINNKLNKPLFTAISMYEEGEENRKIFEYLSNEYNKNKDFLSREQEENYNWALKTLILCGL